ncbi:MAG: VanZ family protein [Candidatus Nanopelagicales bacterium]
MNQAVPWALPFFGLSVVVGVLVGIAGRSRFRAPWWCVWAVIASAGLAIGYTLTPTGQTYQDVGVCGLELTIPQVTPDLFYRPSLEALNIWLFVPLGLSAMLLTHSSRMSAWIALGVLATPIAIEAVQAAIPALGRSCAADDVLYTMVGAGIGLVLGLIASHGHAIARKRRANGN